MSNQNYKKQNIVKDQPKSQIMSAEIKKDELLTRAKKLPNLESRFYVMSVNAGRKISGFGDCPKGQWVEVPFAVFAAIENVVKNGSGDWQIKTEKRMEDIL